MTHLSDLAQVVRAALAGFSQHDRLLRLHTPLGPEVLLAEEATVTESIGPCEGVCGLRIELTALSVSAHLDLNELIGQPARLDLLTAASRTELRPFHGHITRASLLGSDAGWARHALVIEPWVSLLAHRVDSRCFQGLSVPAIVDQVFARYQNQAALMPAWRWALADTQAYPQRSLCIQYQESDLAFVSRLLREEGLFWWLEHEAGQGQTLGRHTLVIADHNGALAPARPECVRYTQAVASTTEDSVHHWIEQRRSHAAQVSLASWDYRSVGMRPVQVDAAPQLSQNGTCAADATGWSDVPGLYAYEDSTQGQRLAQRWMDALAARSHLAQGRGSARHLHAGCHFTLSGHPRHPGGIDARYAVLRVVHHVRNNLGADPRAHIDLPTASDARDQDDRPIYRQELLALPLSHAVRASVLDGLEGQAPVHPRPTVVGAQTALVVGLEGPVHTDRDHRLKIQFHWQRGEQSSHRLGSDDDRNDAPASDASGTWVRVAESWAGDNWGTHSLPRLGQEVVVQFLDGDIDRPVVIGAVYNGRAREDGQGNDVNGGAARSTGNAPAWFPGSAAPAQPQADAAPMEGHQHPAVLSGYKSQELTASQDGTGGCNQLVFDDTPGQGRIELSSTTAHSQLQLGHLLHQSDNQRLQPRGHGAELRTQASGAVRAGAGLMLSAHARPGGSTQASHQLDTREAQAQLGRGQQLQHSLAQSARDHQAHTEAQAPSERLANHTGWQAAQQSLAATDTVGAGAPALSDGEDRPPSAIGGGQGRVSAWGRPELLACAPGGLAFTTPAHHLVSAGASLSLVAGQDLEHMAQRHHSVMAAQGIVGYTYGRASNPRRPIQDTGIRLHAASGSVTSRSASGATRIAAQGRVDVTSTHAGIHIQAPRHLLMTAAGSGLKIEGSNITLTTPGRAQFKATVRSLEGAGSASASLQMPQVGTLAPCPSKIRDAAVQGESAL
ncbi:type VI secretion system Vgr family protein [Caldimonas caldifontis]|uniref:Type VI secretion system tip protein VgrG n=1 Tax=Caldimonas caldifontis TaxID=1452508 RepID=A0A2S5SY45_9BURK|nr:type VI secretion system Vgr family protein [Caldimonas caldifontis]PPE67693.1 type VI secretion system tip protein VgrG [Caldimonas caldifontis]